MTVTIVNGDCLVAMRQMSAASIDLVFTSPPYNIGKAYERKTSMAAYEEWIWPIIIETVRLMKPGASACWQVGNHVNKGEVLPLDYVFMPMLARAGLTMRQRIVWTFGHGLHATKRFSGRHETILWFTKGLPTYDVWVDDDVWKVTNVKHNHPEKTAHPCQFPEGLVAPFVAGVTKPGDIILDPFFGAGTCGAVAEKTGRDCIGVEMMQEYVAIAEARIRRINPLIGGDIIVQALAA